MEIAEAGGSLLDALRDHAGATSVKDGCSPQGQCGCCTVLVDGSARVACVTPLRRVAGRSVTTVEGLHPGTRQALVDAFADAGASQCGFCTPGILVRLAALDAGVDAGRVESALLAHLCRCTGWRTIVDAGVAARGPGPRPRTGGDRDLACAARRAELEGHTPQAVGADVITGGAPFAADTAPEGCLVAVPDGSGGWQTGETVAAARARVPKVQGRRSGQPLHPPLALPAGDWSVTLRTGWVEPAYLEPDASWCRPGEPPVSAAANGGAFGAKTDSVACRAARHLADEHGRTVLVVLSREDVVRMAPKRPPIAAGVRADGSGVLRMVATPGVAAAVAAVAPRLDVEEVEVMGPPTGATVRGAGWVEAAVLLAAVRSRAAGASGADADHPVSITSPAGATASARVDLDPVGAPARVDVRVRCGPVLDEVVLRSYAVGAAHMALGWVCAEGIAVDDEGRPTDLTVRSFGILRAKDTPPVQVEVVEGEGPAVNGSDAVFAAVAAATWVAQGLPPAWPTRRGSYR